jgi:hypothetical protein
VDPLAFSDAFLTRFEDLVADSNLDGIWADNRFAYRLSGPSAHSQCAIFGERIVVIGDSPQVLDLTEFALPICHLNRSGIELLRFGRNTVEVCVALNQRDKLVRLSNC